jgi:hypothetical protein
MRTQPCGCPPHHRAPRPSPVGHSGRGNARLRTPASDTGHPRVDIARVDTGRSYRTLDAGRADACRGRGQGDQTRPAPGHPGLPRRAAARWDAEPCSCGRRLRCSATMTARSEPPASATTYRTTRQLLGRSPPAKPRLGALLSSDDFGSRGERDGGLHPFMATLKDERGGSISGARSTWR